jgi:hypothetical protein
VSDLLTLVGVVPLEKRKTTEEYKKVSVNGIYEQPGIKLAQTLGVLKSRK